MGKLFTNSGDPDQMPHSAASDLGLHCLPVTLLEVSRLQWVKSKPFSEWRYKQFLQGCSYVQGLFPLSSTCISYLGYDMFCFPEDLFSFM